MAYNPLKFKTEKVSRIMTCQKITQVITDFVKTLNQVRTFFRNFRDSSSENHHVKAQILREREKKLKQNSKFSLHIDTYIYQTLLKNSLTIIK